MEHDKVSSDELKAEPFFLFVSLTPTRRDIAESMHLSLLFKSKL